MADDQMRTRAFVVRLSEDELASWHAAARHDGHGKTAAWVRHLVAARATSVPSSAAERAVRALHAEDQAVLERMVVEHSRIGANLNQIARHANIAREVDRDVLDALGRVRADLDELVRWSVAWFDARTAAGRAIIEDDQR